MESRAEFVRALITEMDKQPKAPDDAEAFARFRSLLESIVDQPEAVATEPAGGLMTTGEAAAALGIRSINTVKRWALNGQLDGYRRGARILVSRSSVERLLKTPTVAEQAEAERQLADDLSVLELGDDEELNDESSAVWSGRKPWATGARSGT